MPKVRKEFKTGKKKLEIEAWAELQPPPPSALGYCRGACDGAKERRDGPAHTGFFSPREPWRGSSRGNPAVLVSSKPAPRSPLVPSLCGAVFRSPGALRAGRFRSSVEPRFPVPQALPPFSHAGFKPSQLFVGLVENVKVSGAPAPPDSQAPLHVFVLKAAHNCVLCYESSIHQRPGKGRTEQRRTLQRGAALLTQHAAAHLGGTDSKAFLSSYRISFYKLQILEKGERNKERDQKLCRGKSKQLSDAGEDF